MFGRFQRLDRYSDMIAALTALVLVAALAANAAVPGSNLEWLAELPVQAGAQIKA